MNMAPTKSSISSSPTPAQQFMEQWNSGILLEDISSDTTSDIVSTTSDIVSTSSEINLIVNNDADSDKNDASPTSRSVVARMASGVKKSFKKKVWRPFNHNDVDNFVTDEEMDDSQSIMSTSASVITTATSILGPKFLKAYKNFKELGTFPVIDKQKLYLAPQTWSDNTSSIDYLLRPSGSMQAHTTVYNMATKKAEFFLRLRFKNSKTYFNFFDVRNSNQPVLLYECSKKMNRHHVRILIKDPKQVAKIMAKVKEAGNDIPGTGKTDITLPNRGAPIPPKGYEDKPKMQSRKPTLYEERTIHAWIPADMGEPEIYQIEYLGWRFNWKAKSEISDDWLCIASKMSEGGDGYDLVDSSFTLGFIGFRRYSTQMGKKFYGIDRYRCLRWYTDMPAELQTIEFHAFYIFMGVLIRFLSDQQFGRLITDAMAPRLDITNRLTHIEIPRPVNRFAQSEIAESRVETDI